MRPHYEGSVGQNIRHGILQYCAERYADAKYKFKRDWFFKGGGGGSERIEELREDPSPFMTPIDWNLLLDYYMRDERLQQSNTNRQNRRQAPYPSLHGAKLYVEICHDMVTHFSLNV